MTCTSMFEHHSYVPPPFLVEVSFPTHTLFSRNAPALLCTQPLQGLWCTYNCDDAPRSDSTAQKRNPRSRMLLSPHLTGHDEDMFQAGLIHFLPHKFGFWLEIINFTFRVKPLDVKLSQKLSGSFSTVDTGKHRNIICKGSQKKERHRGKYRWETYLNSSGFSVTGPIDSKGPPASLLTEVLHVPFQ